MTRCSHSRARTEVDGGVVQSVNEEHPRGTVLVGAGNGDRWNWRLCQLRAICDHAATRTGQSSPICRHVSVVVFCCFLGGTLLEVGLSKLQVILRRRKQTNRRSIAVSERTRRMARRRSLTIHAIFASAMLVSLFAPCFAFGLVCSALILHLRPEAAGSWPCLSFRDRK